MKRAGPPAMAFPFCRNARGGKAVKEIKSAVPVMLLAAIAVLFAPHARAENATGAISDYCTRNIGKPEIVRVSERVWVAIGYDLSNVILIRTAEGNVIVDSAMTRGRAREIIAAFDAAGLSGPVKALIFTHSHIDHIGGAAEFAAADTQIWATGAFEKHFFKQYGLFGSIESLRGGRQFGRRIDDKDAPCSALGLKVDFEGALDSGVLLPTHTFTGAKTLEIGGVRIELIEAHGETHDHLMVWLPDEKTLIPGDNYYPSFPNIYTLRGTSPRDVDAWIESVDIIRRLAPERLAPCHTRPLSGAAEIGETLTSYRDAMQWVRDEVVRRANAGEDLDSIGENVRLPAHLAEKEWNREFYGQVDWSAKAVFANNLGWFDGRPEALYPLPARDAAAREVALIGGAEKVLSLAEGALADSDPRWAVHLLSKLKRSAAADPNQAVRVDAALIAAYEKLAAGVHNTNGRSYLLESAVELRDGPATPKPVTQDPRMIERIPLEQIFFVMSTRLDAAAAMELHQSVRFRFPDVKRQFTLTVRRGIAEAAADEPFPGAPEPIAVITIDSADFRRLAMGLDAPAAMFAKGKIKVTGNMAEFVKFLKLFQKKD